MPLKLLALVMAGRGTRRLELSELSVLLQGRGSPFGGWVSVSELLCQLASEGLARDLVRVKVSLSVSIKNPVLTFNYVGFQISYA